MNDFMGEDQVDQVRSKVFRWLAKLVEYFRKINFIRIHSVK